jgi:hypothetical protein
MKHIFYFIGILYILYEINFLLKPFAHVQKVKKMKELSDENKTNKWSKYSDEYKDIIFTIAFPNALIFFWSFLGLLTFNWVAFTFLIFFNFIVIVPISKLFNFNLAYTILHWLNSLLTIVIVIFIIINSYHLKLNLFDIVKGWFF